MPNPPQKTGPFSDALAALNPSIYADGTFAGEFNGSNSQVTVVYDFAWKNFTDALNVLLGTTTVTMDDQGRPKTLTRKPPEQHWTWPQLYCRSAAFRALTNRIGTDDSTPPKILYPAVRITARFEPVEYSVDPADPAAWCIERVGLLGDMISQPTRTFRWQLPAPGKTSTAPELLEDSPAKTFVGVKYSMIWKEIPNQCWDLKFIASKLGKVNSDPVDFGAWEVHPLLAGKMLFLGADINFEPDRMGNDAWSVQFDFHVAPNDHRQVWRPASGKFEYIYVNGVEQPTPPPTVPDGALYDEVTMSDLWVWPHPVS